MVSVEDGSASRSANVGIDSATAEKGALRELTRAVALALQDEGLRRRIGTDMGKSRVREHKLELARYLRGNGGELLAKLSTQAGLARDSLAAQLATVRPLEFYMPVRAHRRTWTGDANLVVAAALDDESIVAFDLRGDPVSLSTSEPPATPTLVLVPVETDFAAAEAAGTSEAAMAMAAPPAGDDTADFEVCDPATVLIPCDDGGGGGGGGGGPGPYPAGVYFSRLDVRDDHEPWLRGAPEIDLVFSGFVTGVWRPTIFNPVTRQWIETYDPNARRLVYADCAGKSAAGFRSFNAGTGTTAPFYNRLFAQTESFAVVEEVYDSTHSIVVRRRQVQLQPPFQAVLMERDDGHQCPDPPKTFALEGAIMFRFNGFPLRFQRFGWEDVMALFGNNNDTIATFFFPSFDDLEGLNGSFRPGMDADAWFVNRGFNRANVPPPQDPWNGQ